MIAAAEELFAQAEERGAELARLEKMRRTQARAVADREEENDGEGAGEDDSSSHSSQSYYDSDDSSSIEAESDDDEEGEEEGEEEGGEGEGGHVEERRDAEPARRPSALATAAVPADASDEDDDNMPLSAIISRQGVTQAAWPQQTPQPERQDEAPTVSRETPPDSTVDKAPTVSRETPPDSTVEEADSTEAARPAAETVQTPMVVGPPPAARKIAQGTRVRVWWDDDQSYKGQVVEVRSQGSHACSVD